MKSGSILVDSRNASSASSYQKECRAASPRRKCACAFSEPAVGNSTFPSCEVWALTADMKIASRLMAKTAAPNLSLHPLRGFMNTTWDTNQVSFRYDSSQCNKDSSPSG